MFDSIKKYDFEILVFGSMVFLFLYIIYRKCKGARGRYTPFRRNLGFLFNQRSKKRGPPTESRGEKECKRVLEKIYKRPFIKTRPDFLRNTITEAGNLEIDCFNQELRLGCEYSGQQHYKYIPFFHKSKEAFYNQKYRDDYKRTKCRENGITLIEVPYTVPTEQIEQYIIKNLRDSGKL